MRASVPRPAPSTGPVAPRHAGEALAAQRRPGPLRRLLRRPMVLLFVLFVASVPLVTPYLRGDGVEYYAWLRSAVIDRDLDFENEFRRGDPAFVAGAFDEEGKLTSSPTPTGHVRNPAPVGVAVLWAPAFLVAHAVVLLGGAVGAGWPADGYALPYLWLTALGTALYAFLGLVLAFRMARDTSGPGPALAGTVAVWGATSLVVYQYFLPFWPFGAGIFVAALLLTVWRRAGWGVGHWAAMGLLSGLLVTVHPVGLAWLALPGLSLLGLDRGRLAERARAGGVFAGAALLAAAPQLLARAIVLGSPLAPGYVEAEWSFLQPSFLRVLFGAEHGLVSWTPAAGVALVGVWLVHRRKDRRLGLGLLAVFGAMLYMVAAYATPEQSSYGNRFFVLYVPGFVVGAAAVAELVWSRRRAVVWAMAVLISWNALLAFQWAWGMIPKRGTVDWGEVARNQFTAAPRELGRAIWLFATDRQALVELIQEKDLAALQAGSDPTLERGG